MASDRTWFRKRILAWRTGFLVDTAEEERFLIMLTTDPECRQQAEMFRDQRSDEARADGHIPSSIVARWNEARVSLKGLERVLVARHLRDCSDCREELSLLGFEPIMKQVSASAPPPLDAPSPRPFMAAPLAPSWLRWALGGWAIAASVAALLLFLLDGGPDRSRGPAVIAPTFLLELTRDAAVTEFVVPPETEAVVISLPALPAGAGAETARFQVEGPDGRKILRGKAPAPRQAANATIVLTEVDGRIAYGTYRFTWIYTETGSGEERRLTIPFNVVALDG